MVLDDLGMPRGRAEASLDETPPTVRPPQQKPVPTVNLSCLSLVGSASWVDKVVFTLFLTQMQKQAWALQSGWALKGVVEVRSMAEGAGRAVNHRSLAPKDVGPSQYQ